MKKELKLGIFVVSIIVISFFVLNYLRGEDIFGREYELTARYENVEGLVASAPVFIKGYKAGKVVEVNYDSKAGDFIVTCSVSKQFKVPSDSRMTIYGVDIMGSKGVKIELGSSDTFASDGAALTSSLEVGLIDGLASSMGPLIDKVTSTLDSLSVTVAGINKLLSEENQASISRTLKNLDRTMANVNSLSSSINGKSSELNSLIDNLSSFSSGLVAVAEKADTTLTGVNRIVDTIAASDIEGVIVSMKQLLENLNDPDGTIGSLLVKDSVYNSVDSLLKDINILVKKIQENPRKYLKISVF